MPTGARCLIFIIFAAVASSFPAFADPMRGIWVYKTELVMSSTEERAGLFEFCKERQITDLFWQVHFSPAGISPCTLENEELTRGFLREANARALRVHALTGDPSHTRREKHDRVLAYTDALIAFAGDSSPEARFHGLHLDIEPHGLPEWKGASGEAGSAVKVSLLTQWVAIHYLVAERLSESGTSLVLGSDIVFWLDKMNPDGSPVYPVTFRGVKKDPAKHLLDVVDHVAIMSYRDTAEGRNGIISLVGKTIDYADTTKARVFVGVKMADIGPEKESFFGQTETQMIAALKPVEETFRPHPGYAGLAFFHYEAYKVMP